MSSLFPLEFDHQNKPAIDPCERKHGGAETSVAAFERAKLSATDYRLACFEYIRSRRADGATSKEVASYLSKHLNEISGRLAELKHAGLVIDSGRRRDGCAVLVEAQP